MVFVESLFNCLDKFIIFNFSFCFSILFFIGKRLVIVLNRIVFSIIVFFMFKDRYFKFGNWGCLVFFILDYEAKLERSI